MMKNRKLVKGIALAAVITALAAGGTAAYLTDFETATNSFTGGQYRSGSYSGDPEGPLCSK